MMHRMRQILGASGLAVLTPALALTAQAPQPGSGAAAVMASYEKFEYRIPMRDGVPLFTSVYVPRDTTHTYPILMTRTPYGVGPYGAEAYRASLGPSPQFQREGFIFVYQDVRGRWMSEGTFTHMTPFRAIKQGPQDVDESSDAYDTIDWLIQHVPRNNGRVGITGVSYPGFYTSESCIDAHPALVACSPQAPMTDVARGDDAFHNGAFLLVHFLSFHLRFGRGPRVGPGPDPQYPMPEGMEDSYRFFLDLVPVASIEDRYFRGTAPLWVELTQHPNYDAFWQERDLRPHLTNMRPAMLVVGGWYDAEDLFGALATYRAIERQSPGATNTLVMGPWYHGQWNRDAGEHLGHAQFGAPTGLFFQDSVQFPFFMQYLKEAPPANLPEALVFEGGTNTWRRESAWPPTAATPRALYLHPGGQLSFQAPPPRAGSSEYDQYVSDPAKPVPFIGWIASRMPREYMTADQRFAAQRPDVLVYETDPLTQDITVAGPVTPVLHVATSGTDADFVVKLIDVFPDDSARDPNDSTFVMSGYQQLVRGEPFRGRFRRDFERPVAFVPNRPDSLRFTMPDIYFTFRKGHRIMVQLQSSWFPYIDRNPQTFVPNVFQARASDYRTATMRVYRSAERPTRLELLVLPTGGSR
jgi:putative CocE/NonD family hydrolase